MLELSKLTRQADTMGAAVARRRLDQHDLLQRAQADLGQHARVDDLLRQKIARACAEDASWRGADPLGDSLGERHLPEGPPQPATLLAADGSQIYPDRHAVAPYYLLNVGTILLRQDAAEAPVVRSEPALFYEESDLYDETGRLKDSEYVNGQRHRLEFETLAQHAEEERAALGGDVSRPIVALVDGPLLLWTAQRATDREISMEVRRFARQLARFRGARVVPMGYVDRPASANVLRTLELADISLEDVTRDKVRAGLYRRLTDRLLFSGLEPGQRSGLFASTSQMNGLLRDTGHRIIFFYLNASQRAGADHAAIVRVEVPEWIASEPALLDLAHQAVYADCRLTEYPYVLARAHELAVVSTADRAEFEMLVGQAMLRHGVPPVISTKAEMKRLTATRPRRHP